MLHNFGLFCLALLKEKVGLSTNATLHKEELMVEAKLCWYIKQYLLLLTV
jgi:hypothetical protein